MLIDLGGNFECWVLHLITDVKFTWLVLDQGLSDIDNSTNARVTLQILHLILFIPGKKRKISLGLTIW